MTNEELDKATGDEAERRWREGGGDVGLVRSLSEVATIAARLARENWTPPEPVDPDVLAFREWDATHDYGVIPTIKGAYLAGARMARNQEQERAKVLVEFAKSRVPLTDAADVALAKYRGEA
jgi:hypothetical protein